MDEKTLVHCHTELNQLHIHLIAVASILQQEKNFCSWTERWEWRVFLGPHFLYIYIWWKRVTQLFVNLEVRVSAAPHPGLTHGQPARVSSITPMLYSLTLHVTMSTSTPVMACFQFSPNWWDCDNPGRYMLYVPCAAHSVANPVETWNHSTATSLQLDPLPLIQTGPEAHRFLAQFH